MRMTFTSEQARVAAANWPAFASQLRSATRQGDLWLVDIPSDPFRSPLAAPHPPRLGDLAAALLRHLGIAAAVARLHPRGTCRCASRQAWLNRHSLTIERLAWLLVAALANYQAFRALR